MTATTSAPAVPATTSTGTTAGGAGDHFGITLSGVADVVKQVEGLVGSAGGTASQVADVVLDVLAFAGIGSTVGAQNAAMNAAHVESLAKVLELITRVKGLVEQAAQGYADADRATAEGFDATGDTATTATTATGTSGTAVTDPTAATTAAATPAATPAADTSGPYGNGMSPYTSPNPHPAALRTDAQGHTHYDMTGHTPPTDRPAGDLDSWITDARTILGNTGVDTSTVSDSDLRALITHESSGNPHALNDWDSNARAGIPSKGLMQTIDSTFAQHAAPGHTDVWNPVDNIVAGVRYGIDRYGSFDRIPGVRALHHGAGYVGY